MIKQEYIDQLFTKLKEPTNDYISQLFNYVKTGIKPTQTSTPQTITEEQIPAISKKAGEIVSGFAPRTTKMIGRAGEVGLPQAGKEFLTFRQPEEEGFVSEIKKKAEYYKTKEEIPELTKNQLK